MLRLLDLHDVESPLPDDRKDWRHPGQHSDTADGRMLATIAERVNGITEKIDAIHSDAHALFTQLDRKIDLLDVRVDNLERDRTRMYSYLIAAGVVLTFLSPIAQGLLKVVFHLP